MWPALRRRLGVLIPLLALVALAFVPITSHAGEWLRDHLPTGSVRTPLVQKHIQLGDTLLPWALGIFVVAVVVWWLDRRSARSLRSALPGWVTAVVAVVAVAVSVGGVYQLYRIGDSGAKAVWTGNFSQTATSHSGG